MRRIIFALLITGLILGCATNEFKSVGPAGPVNTVIDSIAPRVIASYPAPSALDIPYDTILSVTFSEKMDSASFTPNSIYLQKGYEYSLDYLDDDSTLIITPRWSLLPEQTYHPVLYGTITDNAGNQVATNFRWSFTTRASDTIVVDSSLPFVESHQPTSDQLNIPQYTPIIISFSKDMDPATMTLSNIIIEPAIAGTLEYSDRMAKFTPHEEFATDTSYTVTLTDGVHDLLGRSLIDNESWSFSSGEYTGPPVIVATTPINGMNNVPIDFPIEVRFNYLMNPATINESTFMVNDGATGTVVCDGSTATFYPDPDLIYNHTYLVSVLGSVEDILGNPLGAGFTFVFTTIQDFRPPTIDSTYPGDNTDSIAQSSQMIVYFSEEIDTITVNASTLFLDHGVTGSYVFDSAFVTILPDTLLTINQTYTVTATSGITDKNGNHLESDYSWSFTTTDNPVPPDSLVLMPLAVGNQWIYRVYATDTLHTYELYDDTITIVRDTMIEAIQWFLDQDDKLYANFADGLYGTTVGDTIGLLIKYPVALNNIFTSGLIADGYYPSPRPKTLTVTQLDKIYTVPPGTFTCIEYSQVSESWSYYSDLFYYYAVGVGLIEYKNVPHPQEMHNGARAYVHKLIEYTIN